nr:NAD(P)-dependent oxidoreductase [Phycisphaerae bacterium]
MKIVVACELPDPALDELRTLTPDVHYLPQASPSELRDSLADAGILIVGTTRVSPELITRAPVLQMIVHAGSGPGDVAVEDASAAGVFVTHCPDKDAEAIAELTLGLILALDRRIVSNTVALRENRWTRGESTDARGLYNRTLGILGYGAVGRLVAQRALAFGMRVRAWSPEPVDTPPEFNIEFCNWPRELARDCDVIAVLPAGDPNELLVDAAFLQSMPDGAYLVHVGHPGAV